MKPIEGKDVIVERLNSTTGVYELFVCATDCRITITPELIESSTAGTGRGFDWRVRRIGYTLTLSGVSVIDDAYFTVFDAVNIQRIYAGEKLKMTFTDSTGAARVFGMDAILESSDVGGGVDDFSDYNLSYRGKKLYTITDQSGTPVGVTGIGSMVIGSSFTVA